MVIDEEPVESAWGVGTVGVGPGEHGLGAQDDGRDWGEVLLVDTDVFGQYF